MQINAKSINVFKFGGTSVADLDSMRRCVAKVKKFAGPTVVVVSAQAGKTDELIDSVAQYAKQGVIFNKTESDMLITTGENISAATFSALLNSNGLKSAPLCGWQLPILIRDSSIMDIDTEMLFSLLESGFIAVITGFQGVNQSARIESLSRGGSDLTAVCVAKFLGAATCHIYTDVPGMYQISPKLLDPQQNKILSHMNYADAYEMAANGAKVMHAEAVRQAEAGGVEILIKSTFANDDICTRIDAFGPKNYGVSVAKKDNAFLIHILHNNLIPVSEFIEYSCAQTENALWVPTDDLEPFRGPLSKVFTV